MSWHNDRVPIGRDAQEVTSTGSGSIGREVKDVSEEDAACARDAHGQTAPEIPALSPPRTAREFEQALREKLGFSKRQAKSIAARGFKALDLEDSNAEDESELDQLCAALRGATK